MTSNILNPLKNMNNLAIRLVLDCVKIFAVLFLFYFLVSIAVP